VGLALPHMARLAFGTALCQTGDGYRLASRGLSPLLGMEESVLRRSPDGISGSSESHPAHEPRWGAPRIYGELLIAVLRRNIPLQSFANRSMSPGKTFVYLSGKSLLKVSL